jgi:4-nitrophenyl phosphatase
LLPFLSERLCWQECYVPCDERDTMRGVFRFEEVEGLILDIDGTLFWGGNPVPGFDRLFAFVREQRIRFVVASNNSTKSPVTYQRRFGHLGVRVELERILTAGVVTVEYLWRELGTGAPLYVIGEAALLDALQRAGFVLREDAVGPVEAVVVGGDSGLTYEKLKHATLLVQGGARLVGTNPDVLCPSEEGLVPEAGATLAALQAASGVTPTIVGKPERVLFDLAVERMGKARGQIAVVGDRLETDIVGGQRAGLRTILTTSGVDNERTMVEKGIKPDLVVSGLEALVAMWQERLEEARDECT